MMLAAVFAPMVIAIGGQPAAPNRSVAATAYHARRATASHRGGRACRKEWRSTVLIGSLAPFVPAEYRVRTCPSRGVSCHIAPSRARRSARRGTEARSISADGTEWQDSWPNRSYRIDAAGQGPRLLGRL